MTTIVIELPEALARQLQDKQISEQEIRLITIAALELWLARRDVPLQQETNQYERFSKSAVSFVRRLIRENQELFETLAQR